MHRVARTARTRSCARTSCCRASLSCRSQAKKEAAADPFAPEFGIETWHQRHADLPAHVKAAAASLSVWKMRNPNERKHVRTNRRRK